MRWTSEAKEAARLVDVLDLTHRVLLRKAVALEEASGLCSKRQRSP
jgi:hypothetical protein